MYRAHIIIGVTFVIIFLGTGVWMRMNFPDAWRNDEGLHMMFRAGHIYILFSALLNLMAAIRRPSSVSLVEPRRWTWRAAALRLGSCLLLIAPAVLLAAFVSELAPHAFDRPLSRLGVIMGAVGALLIALGSAGRSTDRASEDRTAR